MTEPLYTLHILRLAAETVAAPRLAGPALTAERRSPVCGSRITVDLVIGEDGRIEAYGHDVRACALGQASASLVARHVVGRNAADLEPVRDALAAFLSETTHAMPDWPGIDVLARARPYPARHAAILLPFEAVVEAAAKVKVH